MTFRVQELRRARADKRSIFEWNHERSRPGAIAWLAAPDRMIERLKANADSFGESPENATLEADVKQALFKTRRGGVYRALFVIEAREFFILRVRSPGRGPVAAGEIDPL